MSNFKVFKGIMFKRFKQLTACVAPVMLASVMLIAVAGCNNDSNGSGDTGPKPKVDMSFITSTTPEDGAVDVAVNTPILATFSQKMDPASIALPGAVSVKKLGTDVPGVFTYGTIAGVETLTFTPTVALSPGQLYTATVTTLVTTLAIPAIVADPLAVPPVVAAPAEPAKPMTHDVAWIFTTKALTGSARMPIPLGEVGHYAVFAESAITNTGTSAITGDIGIHPFAASFMTGFAFNGFPGTDGFDTSAQIIGKAYAPDYPEPTATLVNTARLDKDTAQVAVMAATLPDATELAAGDLSGLTLPPGLYKWSSAILINSDLTLDAAGDSNAVWLFQVDGALTQAAAVQVVLSGGALPKNVFWAVEAATLGSTSTMQGNLFSRSAITMGANAIIKGRALAHTAVTMDGATITRP